MPGNKRRTSIAADSSPFRSYAVRIAAAASSENKHGGQHDAAGGGKQASPQLVVDHRPINSTTRDNGDYRA
jgi:hypothetical protein